MKKGIWFAVISILLGSWPCEAQLLGFGQRAKKRKLMLTQIAALAIYDRQHAVGYVITGNGLQDAHSQKDSEFVAHQDYYNSLSRVNPAIGAEEKKKTLITYQSRINKAFDTEIGWQKRHRGLRRGELDHLVKVANNLIQKCRADIQEMQDLVAPGKLKLTDAERLDRSDRLLAAMKDKLAFTLSFTGQCRQLAQARLGSERDIEEVKKLYGN